MTTAYLAISILKTSNIPIDQLKLFLTYVNEKALEEYVNITGIYKGKKNLTTLELIQLIINGNKSNNSNKNNELLMRSIIY